MLSKLPSLKKLTRCLIFGLSLVILYVLSPKSAVAQSQCDQYAGYYCYCEQRTYDRCNGPYYDGNRAYYDCYASQNSQMCTGKIYCGRLDRAFSGVNPTGVNNQNQVMDPTCDAVNKITTCNQTTYDNCTLNYEGDRAYYDCFANQNNQCRGKIYCAPLDRNQYQYQPTPIAPGGPAVVNCPTGTIPSNTGQNTVICVSNSSTNNNNNTTGNNTNTNSTGPITNTVSSTNNVSATATGGAGGSSNVTINGVRQNPQTIRVVLASGNSGVGTSAGQVVTHVKQLPNTGLPTLAWSALAFVPAGLGMRRFNKIKEDFAKSASFLWDERKFKSGI